MQRISALLSKFLLWNCSTGELGGGQLLGLSRNLVPERNSESDEGLGGGGKEFLPKKGELCLAMMFLTVPKRVFQGLDWFLWMVN